MYICLRILMRFCSASAARSSVVLTLLLFIKIAYNKDAAAIIF